MDQANQEAIEQLAEEAMRTLNDVIDASVLMTQKEAALRQLATKLADTPMPEQEEWKRDTITLWRHMADAIANAVAVLDGRQPTHKL